jgi:NADH-quinone oxidoreductase subunit N
MWAPDVYEGAPTITTMVIATASKVSAFAFLVHVIQAMSYWQHFPAAAGFLLAAIATVSILWGNIGALVQTNMKRMLAYSSIAHGGYIAVGISTLVAPDVFSDAVALGETRNAILFYLFSYTLMNVVAFGIVAYLGPKGEGEISAYRGLAKRCPAIALAFAITMVTLIGLAIPGTVGFWGKFYVFKEAMQSHLVFLAVMGMIGSAISAYYYLRVVVAMYMQDPEEGQAALAGEGFQPNPGHGFVIGLATAMIFLFGFFPPLFFALGGM